VALPNRVRIVRDEGPNRARVVREKRHRQENAGNEKGPTPTPSSQTRSHSPRSVPSRRRKGQRTIGRTAHNYPEARAPLYPELRISYRKSM
jgi:hypothetical protein